MGGWVGVILKDGVNQVASSLAMGNIHFRSLGNWMIKYLSFSVFLDF